MVALFKFRRRTRTCLIQTVASSAPEFEQGDNGADICSVHGVPQEHSAMYSVRSRRASTGLKSKPRIACGSGGPQRASRGPHEENYHV